MDHSVIAGVMVGLTVGTMLTAAPQTPTYHQDVRPILEKSCLGCHSPGGAGRLPLWTYDDARQYAKQIVGVVTGKAMPRPQHYGLLGEKGTLSKAEIDVIARWAAAGAPEGSRNPKPSHDE